MAKIGTFSIHPAADEFPLLEGVEFEALVTDIAENRQINPVIVTAEGLLLDGRNRVRACQKLGIEPLTRVYVSPHGNENEAYVAMTVSSNLRRRHLTKSQLAELARRLVPHFAAAAKKDEAARRRESSARQKRQPNGQLGLKRPSSDRTEGTNALRYGGGPQSRDKAAASVGVSGTAVKQAQTIASRRPDLSKKIEAGEVTVSAAYKEVAAHKEVKEAKPAPAPSRSHNKVDVYGACNKVLGQINTWCGKPWSCHGEI